MSEIEEFISNNSSWMIGTAMKMEKNREEAKDLVQDTIVKMIRHKRSFEEGTNIKGWAYLIMKNTFFDGCKKDKKTTHKTTGVDGNRAALSISEGNRGESKIMMEEIHTHINKLDKRQKELFTQYMNGFTYKELAEEFDIPMGTVKGRLFDIKKILKDKILKSNKIKKAKTKK